MVARYTAAEEAASKLLNAHGLVVRVLVSVLIFGLCLWMLAGAAQILLELYRAVTDSWSMASERMIVTAVTLPALLEIIRTLQSYLEIGRVRVTFVLDAALVVLIGELIALGFKGYTALEVVTQLGVITVLTFLRIGTGRYSPPLPRPDESL